MKIFKKIFLIGLLLASVTITNQSILNASSIDSSSIDLGMKDISIENKVLEIPVTVDTSTLISSHIYTSEEDINFDISSNKKQTALVYNPDDTIGAIVLEPIDNLREVDTLPNGYSNWKSTYWNASMSMSYQFTAYNPSSGQSSITDYWGESYTAVGVTSESFNRSSDKTRLTYRITTKSPIGGFSNSWTMESKVNYSTLTTSRY